MAQTQYDLTTGNAYAGMIAYGFTPHADIVTKNVDDATGVEFGSVVQRGSSDTTIGAGGGGIAEVFGIALRTLDREALVLDTNDIFYKDKTPAAIMRYGYVWVTVIAGCTAGDAAWVSDDDGTFRATTDVGFTLTTNVVFETTAADGELAIVRIEP